MRHGSLFSGIGGFDLAAEWMGWENVFHCEWEEFPRSVLHYYWPNAESFGDIKEADFTKYHGSIDIISGGFPCQPYSQAGKRLGKEDERHLWPEMLRAIREIQPRWVVGENVLGIVNWSGGLVFEEVQTDLEAEGYEVQTYVLPAAGVNAPHQRYRVWFVAHSNQRNDGRNTGEDESEGRKERVSEWNEIRKPIEPGEIRRPTSDTVIQRNTSQRQSGGAEEIRSINNAIKEERRQPAEWINGFSGLEQLTSDTYDKKSQRATSERIQANKGRRNGIYHEFTSGNYSEGDWESFPTQSPVRSGNDGISDRLDGITFSKWRNESIKSYGNAVVPQVVLQIFKSIAEYEQICK